MQRQDLLIGLLVIIVWGLNFIAIKLGLQTMPPLLLGSLRFLLACVPAILFLPRPPIRWPWLIALGLSINVGQFAFLFLSMKVGMPAGLASLLLQSQAFFTLFIAVLWLGERLQWNHVVGLILSVCGMTIIGLQQEGTMTLTGFGLILIAAACWGIGNIIMRQATVGVPNFSILSLVVWSGAVAILPLMMLSLAIEGYDAWLTAFHSATWTTVSSVIYLAFFATLVGYGLWGKLLYRYPAAVVSPLALMVPLIGMSSSAMFLGESLSLSQALGALLVMLGLAIHVFGRRWKTSTPST